MFVSPKSCICIGKRNQQPVGCWSFRLTTGSFAAMLKPTRRALVALTLTLCATPALAQTKISNLDSEVTSSSTKGGTAQSPAPLKVTTPKQHFGYNIGDDYFLANYDQTAAYWRKLDKESDRMRLVTIGKTAEGRPQLMAILTSPENHKKLGRYQEIARKLALAEGLNDAQAKALAAQGKAVIWIDGGLHATEVVGTHQIIETVYQMASATDEETRRILDDVILLAVHANPDGQQLVSDWYMRKAEPRERAFNDIPRLYQKYIGHDNNRDSFMNNMPETKNMSRVLFREWFPQIMYNHHQTGPVGTILFAPPFRDPFNYVYDPLIPMQLDLVGGAMHTRFAAEGKPGSTMVDGAGFSTWWNGGLRTTVYFHNMVGLLSEINGSPTPIEIPFVPDRQLPNASLPYPIPPQKVWRFRQSIDYSLSANKAVLDLASKYRKDFLYNIYQMGRNAIAKGSRDHWTTYPKRLAMVKEAIAKDMPPEEAPELSGVGAGYFSKGYPDKYYQMMRTPELRDPRGYIIPADQADFLTATKFVNALIESGITVQKATAPFQAGGKTYPTGSYVIKTAQAFRPHVLDMFEPQDHPNDFAYPGGPPKPPYDNAGWTLAYQMGIQYDRILESFDGPFAKIADVLAPPPGQITGAAGAAGFLLDHRVNDAFVAVNRLLAAGEDVYWLQAPLVASDKTYPAGTFYIPAKPSALPLLAEMAQKVGLVFEGTPSKPGGEAFKMKPLRIALWDRYGGSMPSGWVRWMFEQYQFPFEVVYPQQLDAGNLKRKYDAIVFVDGAIPMSDKAPAGREARFYKQPKAEEIPAEFRDRLGYVSVAKTVPQLRTYLEEGGTVIAVGSSTNLGYHLGLPIENALTEQTAEGKAKPLPPEKYYIPGSILQAKVDNTLPIAHGLPERVNVFFNNSPVFKMKPGAQGAGLQPVALFDSDEPLRSGWAWGQQYLKGGVSIAQAPVGQGKLFLFGPEIVNRAQPHGTFKFLFNGLYYGTASSVQMAAEPGARSAGR
ncbi:peptidase [Gloeobacter morelensis MG652769]|uniref:Peptidase n=2 Tax=Gloeobacter TaxID=33071 RepID=A0ABY3PS22_9CYAN|nr:peptidase [Gloeobacter morelensis MG652769]